MSGTQRCPSCAETHADYEKLGEHTVDGTHHAGIVATYECGRCGSHIEVGRR